MPNLSMCPFNQHFPGFLDLSLLDPSLQRQSCTLRAVTVFERHIFQTQSSNFKIVAETYITDRHYFISTQKFSLTCIQITEAHNDLNTTSIQHLTLYSIHIFFTCADVYGFVFGPVQFRWYFISIKVSLQSMGSLRVRHD